MINFVYTKGVRQFVDLNNFDRTEIENKVTAEMQGLLNDGLSDPLKLILHVFDWQGQEFIMTTGDIGDTRAVIIDLCKYAEGPEITEGPFKGSHLSMPMPMEGREEILDRHPEYIDPKETKH